MPEEILEERCMWKTSAMNHKAPPNKEYDGCNICNGYNKECRKYSTLAKLAANYQPQQEQVSTQ